MLSYSEVTERLYPSGVASNCACVRRPHPVRLFGNIVCTPFLPMADSKASVKYTSQPFSTRGDAATVICMRARLLLPQNTEHSTRNPSRNWLEIIDALLNQLLILGHEQRNFLLWSTRQSTRENC